MKKEFVRYLLVCTMGICIDYGIYILIFNYVNASSAKMLSAMGACIFEYFANKIFTFGQVEQKNNGQKFRYMISVVLNIGCNGLVTQLVFWSTRNRTIAFLFATGIATLFNFVLQKFLVFQKQKEQN